VEARVWATGRIQLAAFVDFGAVLSDSPLGSRTETLVTPGLGIGLVTPFAPVRLDVAYNPSPARSYPLLARDPGGNGYIPLGSVTYEPPRRLQLQFSVISGF
jgi:outer membrane translocation and assembly module TamA